MYLPRPEALHPSWLCMHVTAESLPADSHLRPCCKAAQLKILAVQPSSTETTAFQQNSAAVPSNTIIDSVSG